MKRQNPMFLTLVAAFACSSSTPPGGPHPPTTGGIVPADLRDVERDGEGLVRTTFGEYPDRVPDMMRAASVLSLLKQVWTRGKTAYPGLPAMQVKMLDDAIVAADAAIAANDQKHAVIAANLVGLAVPEIFDYFHPDAPLEIVRMDAVFRQLGIDAHFGKAADAALDVASLKTDWNSSKAAVSTRSPTCHRVGGTATVASDIEQSLTNLDTAVPTGDATTVEKESENGALAIDTLELLFDCPPDNAAPDGGLGARCAGNADCPAGTVCDKANAGGKCVPDPSNQIGTPCANTAECGTDPRSACQTASGDNYMGGYCFMEPCNDIEVCPPGGTCVSLGGETPGCFKACATDADCRVAEGYVCQLFLTTPPIGFGPSDHACAFKCTRDSDCQSAAPGQPGGSLKCDIPSGKCNP